MLKWLKLRSTGFWGSFILVVRTVGGLGMQKLIALFYGPAGTTLFSHFQNFISLFTQPIQDVVSQGFINGFQKETFSKNKLLAAAIALVTFIFPTTLLVLWLTGSFPVQLFSFSTQDWGLVLSSLFLLCIQGLGASLLIARNKLRFLNFLYLAQWAAIFLILLFAGDNNINESLLYFISTQGLFTVIFYALIFQEIRKNLPLSFRLDPAIFQHFTQFLWMGLAVWLSSKWVDYFIRNYAITYFGNIDTGYWQAIVRISEAYRGLYISFLFLTFYPILSKLIQTKGPQIKDYFWRTFKLLAGLSFLFFIFVFIFDQLIIRFLYSDTYLIASSLFKFQMLGDLLAFLSFPFALLLMAAVKTRHYIFCELSSAAVYIAAILLGNSIGIEVLVYAHIIRFVLYLTLVIWFNRKLLKIA